MKIIPILLAGGIGERFWPASRSSMPKQLLPLVTNRSMLEDTLTRVRPLCKGGIRPLVICGASIAGPIRRRVPKSFVYDLIAEPVGKNTAPAVALAAEWVNKKYDDCVMLVLSADHAISPVADYLKAVKFAAAIADGRDMLTVFGIKPSRPDTGYGYIQLGNKIGEQAGIPGYEVRRFVEKPDRTTAEEYVRSGSYLWNSGMFVWKASTILEEFESHMPELYRQTLTAAKAGFSKQAIDRFYRDCVKESIDYGIMERSKRVAVVAGSFSWDDVGSWESVARVKGTNSRGSTVSGKGIFEADCTNSIVVNSSTITVAALGLDNVVLVVTGDSVLAIPRSKLPKIKEYLTKMKQDRGIPKKLF